MMIQFNMLPDVKIEYIKSQRLKRIMIMAAIAASAVSVAFLIITLSYSTVQKAHIGNLDKDITRLKQELESNPDLAQILSVQNQLNSLPALYDGRPAVDRLPGFIDQTTPSGVGIGRMSVDFSTSVVEIAGVASSLEEVNSYVDTLKYTTFKVSDDGEAKPAFSAVVLVDFGKDDVEASFTITFSFDPTIFDTTQDVKLTVPNIVTTRSQVAETDLFDGSLEEGEENGGQ